VRSSSQPWTEQETPLAHYRALLHADGPAALRAALAAHPLLRLRTPDPAARSALDAMLAGYSGADLDAPGAEAGAAFAFDAIDRPVLVLNGAHDTAQRLAAGAALARAIAGARRHVIPGAGHLACLDDPGRYGGLVTEFLRPRIPTSTTLRTDPS
jgi:pimeloyl-ACP methyl ester carboxylesterase